MKKSKTKKTLIIIFLSIFIIALGFFIPKIANKICYPYVKAKAVSYLCDKYDAEKSEFELVDFRHAGLNIDASKNQIFIYYDWKDFAFEFKYKGRSFFVNRYKSRDYFVSRYDDEFFDDYQLEDIEKWCTEWLQNNVDENIVGINLSINEIINYLINCDKSNKYIIKNTDIQEFINSYSFSENDDYDLDVYYFNTSVNSKNKIESQCEMRIKLKEILDLDGRVSANFTTYTIAISIIKPIDSYWKKEYLPSKQNLLKQS